MVGSKTSIVEYALIMHYVRRMAKQWVLFCWVCVLSCARTEWKLDTPYEYTCGQSTELDLRTIQIFHDERLSDAVMVTQIVCVSVAVYDVAVYDEFVLQIILGNGYMFSPVLISGSHLSTTRSSQTRMQTHACPSYSALR